ncbi:hypothetical protein BD310DRAFT_935531 [Dichomitus squalens]|uniref:Uncharacterized protein n=1 Tax=Dichomitus squalens TaxID=114155 RepID=A0A4Q9PKG9_9APHY|nr:hypothetical protein BD310DRAFT_935531 [Dichomitus squalens]
MLLVESGSVYCAICGLVVVFVGISLTHTNALTSPFMNTVAHIYYGCLGPLVAIYPMSIIVLVAVRKSRMENSLHNHLPDYNVDITIMLPQSAIGEKFGTSEGDLTYAPPISSIASEQTSQR